MPGGEDNDDDDDDDDDDHDDHDEDDVLISMEPPGKFTPADMLFL